MVAFERKEIELTYGINRIQLEVAGFDLGIVRQSLGPFMNFSPIAVAYVSGVEMADSYVLRPGDHVEFFKESGHKGATNEIRVWGDGRTSLWTPDGYVDIPDDYGEIETGNYFLTRRIKQLAETVYVRMKRPKRRNGYSSVIGVLAPRSVIEQAEYEAQQTEDRRREQRVKSATARRRQERRKQDQMEVKLRELFPGVPDGEAEEIVAHAFEVGSGRVGRTSTLSDEDKLTLAVIARIRHHYTKYDQLLDRGWDRESARETIRPHVDCILEEWRRPKTDEGEDSDDAIV